MLEEFFKPPFENSWYKNAEQLRLEPQFYVVFYNLNCYKFFYVYELIISSPIL